MSWPHLQREFSKSPGFVTLAIPPRVPNPADDSVRRPTYAETGLDSRAFIPLNPLPIISAERARGLAEFGNRLFDKRKRCIPRHLGFRPDKLFDGTWGYDTGFATAK